MEVPNFGLQKFFTESHGHLALVFPFPVLNMGNMNGRQYNSSSPFDTLFKKYVPHIPEKIFFSLDYASFKTCLKVNSAWKELLTSESYQKEGKSVFHNEILDDEKKLCEAAKNGNVDDVQYLISGNLVDVNCRVRLLWASTARCP